MAGYTHGKRHTRRFAEQERRFKSPEIETLFRNGAELLAWMDVPAYGWVEYIERDPDHPLCGHPFYRIWRVFGKEIKHIQVVGDKGERENNIQVWYARMRQAGKDFNTAM